MYVEGDSVGRSRRGRKGLEGEAKEEKENGGQCGGTLEEGKEKEGHY